VSNDLDLQNCGNGLRCRSLVMICRYQTLDKTSSFYAREAKVNVDKGPTCRISLRSKGRRQDAAWIGPFPIVGDDLPEVTELATIHFDGGGQRPGPVVAACTPVQSNPRGDAGFAAESASSGQSLDNFAIPL
jgi:hypothetical protein